MNLRPQHTHSWLSCRDACTFAGTFLLDIFDHYVSEYGFFIVGALESLAIGWVWGWHEVQARCGTKCALFSKPLWTPYRQCCCILLVLTFLPLPGGCHIARCVLCSAALERNIAVSAVLRVLSPPGTRCTLAQPGLAASSGFGCRSLCAAAYVDASEAARFAG